MAAITALEDCQDAGRAPEKVAVSGKGRQQRKAAKEETEAREETTEGNNRGVGLVTYGVYRAYIGVQQGEGS